MNQLGVGTNVSWPLPLYRQAHLRQFFRDVCPVGESICQRVLCLPLYFELTEPEQQFVVEVLFKALRASTAPAVDRSLLSAGSAQ
jgi:dTDP-4-amino-4,6-dideoxygalactose transaminase